MSPVTDTFLIMLCLGLAASFKLGFCSRNHNINCIQSERQALLRFKQLLNDPSDQLSSWSDDGDCCKWDRIICSNVTGHVVQLHLGAAKLGGKLNPSLLHLKHLTHLDLSDNDLRQTRIPTWFWNMSSNLSYLNLSRNRFQGNIPDLPTTNRPFVLIDLSSNQFSGSLPRLSTDLTAIDLSYNSLSGSMTHFLCHKLNESMKLEILNLGNNLLSGEIPECWNKWPKLVGIKLCYNNFSGKLPSSMGALTLLQSLHTRNNSLVGEIPSSLRNCSELITVDFGSNQLSGDIPPWIGKRLSNLIILSLFTNKFTGTIPEELCALSYLQILDLSHNHLVSEIPSCVNDLSAMNSRNKSDGEIFYKTSKGSFFEDIIIVMKGRVVNYGTTLKLVKTMDLSDNNLCGEIPDGVTSLVDLQSLNFSHNRLFGSIPGNIGAMRSLECFDLSTNNLSGEIPSTITDLNFLNHLNLSYNKFVGKIPTGTQLQSLNASSFIGTELFGSPLTEGSTDSRFNTGSRSSSVGEKLEDGHEVDWLLINVELGFCFGFFCVLVLFMFCKSRGLVCFQYADQMGLSLGRLIRKYIF